MKILMILLGFILVTAPVSSQNNSIITCGEITYEKKESTQRKLKENKDEDDAFWMEEMIKHSPKFTINTFRLKFNDFQSEYYHVPSDIVKSNNWNWGGDLASKNRVFKNFHKNQSISLKQVFEEDILFTDTLRDFKWKLTTEYRNIAGFDCRKATTIINDSLYVIAWYSEDIILPSGPESFGNLPGTILGIAMPRLYLTWFATEVKTDWKFEKPISAPLKGKTRKKDEVDKILKDRFGQYTKWYQGLVWSMAI